MFARMNRVLTLVAAGVMLAVAQLAHAAFIFNFDENGNGSISINGGAFTPLPGVLADDPSQAGVQLVLTYFLPAAATPVGNGTVQVLEPTGGLTDAIRFTDANGALTGGTADRMIFYSDNAEGVDALADTGFPANLTSGAQGGPVTEVGTEGHNTFQFVASGPNIYNGVSDAPEPGTLFLLGMGLISLLARPMTRRWAR